jgi:hypothetical protein
MDAEKLRLLIKLRPIFWKNMGEWIPGDRGITPSGGNTAVWKEILFTSGEYGPDWDEGALRVPDVYSRVPNQPERGLMGMLKNIEYIAPPRKNLEVGWEVVIITSGSDRKRFYGETLDLALLKALEGWMDRKVE